MTCNADSNPFDRSWIAGDSEEIAIRYKDSDGEYISFDSAKMQLRRKVSSDTYALELIGELDDDNTIIFSATPTDTRSLATSITTTYVYDIQITISDDEVKTVGSGTITVSTDITR